MTNDTVGDQFSWVIEHSDSPVSGPMYYSLTPGRMGYWETDHMLAFRFARKQDAEEYASCWLSDADHGIRICEHGWITPRHPANEQPCDHVWSHPPFDENRKCVRCHRTDLIAPGAGSTLADETK